MKIISLSSAFNDVFSGRMKCYGSQKDIHTINKLYFFYSEKHQNHSATTKAFSLSLIRVIRQKENGNKTKLIIIPRG